MKCKNINRGSEEKRSNARLAEFFYCFFATSLTDPIIQEHEC